MKERLVNIFVYGNETHVYAVGWRVYEKTGAYDDATAFLRSRVPHDHRIAARSDLKEPLTWRDFRTLP